MDHQEENARELGIVILYFEWSIKMALVFLRLQKCFYAFYTRQAATFSLQNQFMQMS